MLSTFSYPFLLNVAASSPIAAFLWASVRSPIFRPARGTIVVGRFDHLTRCAASLKSNSTFERCPSSSELRKPFALATIVEATLEELWACASAQARTAIRKLMLCTPYSSENGAPCTSVHRFSNPLRHRNKRRLQNF